VPSPETDFGWHSIPDHTLTLQSLEGVTLRFVARDVLGTSETLHSPSAILFDIVLDGTKPVFYRGVGGFYGSIYEFHRELTSLRQGERDEVDFHLEYLRLRIFKHEFQDRSGYCAELVARNVAHPRRRRPKVPVDELADHAMMECCSAYDLRYVFPVPLSDPPGIEQFLRDVSRFVAFLRDLEP
jgi:hypothetical protein